MTKENKKNRRYGTISFPRDAEEALRKVYKKFEDLPNREEMLDLLNKNKKRPPKLPVAIIETADNETFSVEEKEIKAEKNSGKIKFGDEVSFEPIRKNTWARDIKLVIEF